MKILYADSATLGKTPARVNRMTGEVYVNRDIWNSLPEAYQKFILAHEEGHYVTQETNELLADHYALMKIAGTFRESLKTAVRTITDILPGTNDNQKTRMLNILRVALLYDLVKNPRGRTKERLLQVEKELAAYVNLPQLKEYEMILSQMRKGRPSDYEFPGYDSRLFQPAVGSFFTDIPLSQEQVAAEIENRYSDPVYEHSDPTCRLDLLNRFDVPRKVGFDLKTFGIIVLVALSVVLISKLFRS